VKVGIVMNVICIIVLQFSLSTWGRAYFDLGNFPEWAARNSFTTVDANVTAITDATGFNLTTTQAF
jgi:hypothetical protein